MSKSGVPGPFRPTCACFTESKQPLIVITYRCKFADVLSHEELVRIMRRIVKSDMPFVRIAQIFGESEYSCKYMLAFDYEQVNEQLVHLCAADGETRHHDVSELIIKLLHRINLVRSVSDIGSDADCVDRSYLVTTMLQVLCPGFKSNHWLRVGIAEIVRRQIYTICNTIRDIIDPTSVIAPRPGEKRLLDLKYINQLSEMFAKWAIIHMSDTIVRPPTYFVYNDAVRRLISTPDLVTDIDRKLIRTRLPDRTQDSKLISVVTRLLDNPECPICLEPYANAKFMFLFCTHIICLACQVRLRECPLCRSPLDGISARQIIEYVQQANSFVI